MVTSLKSVDDKREEHGNLPDEWCLGDHPDPRLEQNPDEPMHL